MIAGGMAATARGSFTETYDDGTDTGLWTATFNFRFYLYCSGVVSVESVTGRRSPWIYFSKTLHAATWGAELANGEGPGRIYLVEPTGEA